MRFSRFSGDRISGKVQLVGDRVGLLDSVVNVSGDALGGKVLVQAESQGGLIPLASATYISPTTTITFLGAQERLKSARRCFVPLLSKQA